MTGSGCGYLHRQALDCCFLIVLVAIVDGRKWWYYRCLGGSGSGSDIHECGGMFCDDSGQ